MHDPLLFGIPLSLMFLYFVWYSFLGWGMESAYCSVLQRRWVNRGFLHLPLCPIYGAGVLIMVNFFTPFTGNPFVFYIVAVAGMSAWEYFVGWLLETTTHVKYWDYSDKKFNLKGRICLQVSLWWGVAAYLAIFWIHPATQRLFAGLADRPRIILAAVLLLLILGDAVLTIRDLALFTTAITKAEQARVQLELGRMELEEQLVEKRAELQARADRLRSKLDLPSLEEQREKLLAEAARHAGRFMDHYQSMTIQKHPKLLRELREKVDLRKKKK